MTRAVLLAATFVVALAGCDTRNPALSPAGAAGHAVAAEAERVSDAVLAERVREALRRDETTSGAEIQLSVTEGRVRLSGFVDTAAVRLRAGVLAGQVEGVTAVDNRLIQRHRAEVFADPIGEARVHL